MMKFRTLLRFYGPDDDGGQGESTPVPANSPATGISGDITDEQLEAAAVARFGAPPTESDEAAEAALAAAGDAPTTDDDALPPSTGGEAGDLDGAAADGGGEGAEGAQPPPAAEVPVPPAPTGDAGVDLSNQLIDLGNDLSLTRAEAEQWANFGHFLRANPDTAQAIAAVLEAAETGQPVPPAQAPQAPAGGPETGSQAPTVDATPPEGLDLDDPAIKFLWDQHVAQQTVVADLQAQVGRTQDFVTNQQMQQTESMLNTATAAFAEKHHLTAEEMQKVRDVTGRLQVLPALLSPFDPITAAPRQIDPLAAMDEAFMMAMWNIPEFREREVAARVEEQKVDTKRKGKLASLGGTSGSIPRTPAAPTNKQERTAAMVAEVAEMMKGA